MKLTIVLLTAAFLNVHAAGFSQNVTLAGKNLPLTKVFAAVEKQTGFVFFYTQDLLSDAKPVSIKAQEMPLADFLKIVLKNQHLDFFISDKTVMLSRHIPRFQNTPLVILPTKDPVVQDITGVIVNANTKEPLVGATIAIKSKQASVASSTNGAFTISADIGDMLVITFVGFETREVQVQSQNLGSIALTPAERSMNEVVVNKGYYTTTEKLNTGSVSRVTAEQISRQPISNPLAALQGQVPGLTMYQTSGLPGSDVVINIRGINSINQGSTPLFVIDGVPMASANGYSSGWYKTVDGNVFTALNPNTIESIEVLKDADATSIYGSRGANGVILITTKKGKSGRTTIDLKLQTGISLKASAPKMLNTEQYLALRREAFRNDGVTPTKANAPDLLVWDTTKNTDWVKELTGNTAQTTDAQLNVTGGTKTIQFLLGTGFHRETTPLANTKGYHRGTLHFNIGHQSANDRLRISLTGDYTADNNQLPGDVTTMLNALRTLPPNAPEAFDAEGKLVWTPGLTNPYAMLMRKTISRSHNISGNALISYQLDRGLQLQLSAGSNNTQLRMEGQYPRSTFNPASSPINSAYINTREARSWIAEPQLSYTVAKNKLKFDALLGGSFQNQFVRTETVQGTDFANDKLLTNMSAAGSVVFSNSYAQYRYQAVFSRFGFNWDNKYVLNLSGRRDGSSRFGPHKRFSNFGAVGAAWIFSEEPFLQKLAWLSFGKIRASYGTTGNDQIGDYQYLNTWSRSSLYPYLGTSVMVPDQLFNSDYVWESSRKLDFALDLAFWNDKLSFSLNYYRNVSSNQLTSLSLPLQTGFYSITINQDAVVKNNGWEAVLRSTNINTKNFSWTTSFNIAIPRNELVAYPGIENNSLRFTNVVGQPLGAKYGYQYLGVDPQTGIYTYLDVNKDNRQSNPADYVFLDKTALGIRYNGGLTNSIRFRNFELDIFFNYIHQYKQYTSLASWYKPGAMENMPAFVLDKMWREPGDQTELQKATAVSSSAAYRAANSLSRSDGGYGIASYVRLRNLSFAYQLPDPLIQKLKMQRARLFINGQNLVTFSPFKGFDPEVERVYYLSNLKTITAGFQLNF